jgi:hydrogenase maturation protease
MSRILIAGLGNVFKGDDAFGVAVAQRLAQRALPADVEVVDFGIRGIDLTYALLDGFDAAVLADTVQRGEAPGTVYVIEPEPETQAPQPEDLMLSPHELDPAKVLRMVRALDGRCRRIVLVGCEPETFGDETDGKMGLSAPVEAAVEEAVGVVESLVSELRSNEDQASNGARRMGFGASIAPLPIRYRHGWIAVYKEEV